VVGVSENTWRVSQKGVIFLSHPSSKKGDMVGHPLCYDLRRQIRSPRDYQMANVYDERRNRVTAGKSVTGRRAAAFIFVLAVAGSYLYANLFVLPKTPLLLSGDQVYFWTDAQRMLFGEIPIKDFFQFTPPGTDVFYFALFRCFGPRLWVTNMVVLVLGLALCGVCFSIARKIMPFGPAVLSVVLFLVLVYGRLLNATHHWFSVLIIMVAVSLGMDRMGFLRVWIIGMLLGLASFFTHTHAFAGLLAFILFFAFQRRREGQTFRFLLQRLAILSFGFVAAWFICNLYFLFAVGPQQMWYYEVVFVRRYVVESRAPFLGLPEAPTLRRLPAMSQYLAVYVLVIVIYPLTLAHCWLRRNDRDYPNREKIALLALTGLLLIVEVALSPNWLRIYAVSMPAMVLAIFWIEQWDGFGRYARRVVSAGVLFLAVYQTWSRHRVAYVVTELPAGRAALAPQAYEKFAWIQEHTRPGDFFFQSLVPTMYLPLSLRSPVFIEGLGLTSQTRPEFVQRTIDELSAKPVRYVLWSHYLDQPTANGSAVSAITDFRGYLHDHYRRVWTFSDSDEIWEKQ
jgi:hypothetical protein